MDLTKLTRTQTKALTKYLSEYLSDNKQRKIKEILKNRTRHITIALEDIFQPHNANATLRTCECLGVQDIHIIENRNEFDLSQNVTQGSSKWLNLHRYRENPKLKIQNPNKIQKSNSQIPNTISCLQKLKKQGYQLIATTPDPPQSPLLTKRGEKNASERGEFKQPLTIEEINLNQPIAFLFGTEAEGLTDYALEQADAYLKLPMYGFTQSYNISVSVAITLSQTIKRLHESNIDWKLNKGEKEDLTLEWYQRCIKSSPQLIEKFLAH